MATGQTLIDRACRLIGVVSSGSSATSAESADALIAFNAMLDSWKNDGLMAYSVTEVSKAMVVGDSSYTFVSSGDFNGVRPVEIKSAYMTIGTTSYTVEVISEEEWYAIEVPTTTSDLVEKVWYNPTMSSGTVNVWPVPSATNTLTLVVRSPLSDLALGTTVALPPGWEEAIAYNGAIRIAPEFGAQVPPAVAKMATESLAAIKRINSSAISCRSELVSGGKSNIFTG